MIRRWRWSLGVVCALGTFVAGTTPALAWMPGTILPLQGFGHIVVDQAASQIFVTGGTNDTSIPVLSLDGLPKTTITGEAGAGGMALVGPTLYVARCGQGAIDEIDVATDRRIGTLAADAMPTEGSCELAYAGGLLWYVDDATGDLSSVTLTPPGTVVHTSISVNIMGAELRSTPGLPNDLLATADNSTLYDVSNPADPTVVSTHAGGAGFYGDAVMAPDGSELFAGAGNGLMERYALPGFTFQGTTGDLKYPDAIVALGTSPDSSSVAVGWRDPNSNTGVLGGLSTYPAGGGSATGAWTFGVPVAEYGVAYGDAHTISVITDGSPLETPVLHTISTLPAGSVTLTSAGTTVVEGAGVTLTAHLGTPSANHTLCLYRYPDDGGPPSLVYTGTVGPTGRITDIVHPATDSSYAAIWTGDNSHAASGSALINIRVVPVIHEHLLDAYNISGSYRLYHYSTRCVTAHTTGCPLFTISTAPNLARQIVQVQLEEYLSGAWHLELEKRYNLSSSSALGVYFYYTSTGIENIPTRVRAVFFGQPYVVNPATGAWMYFKVTK